MVEDILDSPEWIKLSSEEELELEPDKEPEAEELPEEELGMQEIDSEKEDYDIGMTDSSEDDHRPSLRFISWLLEFN